MFYQVLVESVQYLKQSTSMMFPTRHAPWWNALLLLLGRYCQLFRLLDVSKPRSIAPARYVQAVGIRDETLAQKGTDASSQALSMMKSKPASSMPRSTE